ncbi:flagellar hook-length control protein FliK, partial [Amnibacterium endophyticum]
LAAATVAPAPAPPAAPARQDAAPGAPAAAVQPVVVGAAQASAAASTPRTAAPDAAGSSTAPAADGAQTQPFTAALSSAVGAQPAASVAPAAPSAPPATPTLPQQLAEPIVLLQSAPDGEHVVIVKVTPENLGPVTVHAHVAHGDLDVQLFAPNADGRDALKSMLSDLRRDPGADAAGTSTTLSLGTGDAPQQQPQGQRDLGASGGGREARPTWQPQGAAARETAATPSAPRPVRSSTALLDVLA